MIIRKMKRLRGLLCGAMFAAGLAVGSSSAEADLLALYQFEGSTTADAPVKQGAFSGQVFNGIATGGGVTLSGDVPGVNGGGQSLMLGGDGNFIDLPINAVNPFDGSQDFTVTTWFKTTGNGDKSIILSSARGNVGGDHAMAFHTGPACCGQAWSSGALIVDNFFVSQVGVGNDQGVNVEDGNWQFGAMTYAAATNTYSIHVSDGVGGYTSASRNFNPAIPNIAADTVRVGDSRNGNFPAPGFFQGNLDDLAIFDHVLSGGELESVRTGDFSAYTSADVHVGGQGNLGMLGVGGTIEGDQVLVPVFDVQAVRLVKNGGFMSLREVEVIDEGGVNVGAASNGGVPTASSIWPTGIHPIAALNDGVKNVPGGGGIAHTGNPPLAQEWMQITLDGPANVTDVHIFNRGDCCTGQGQNLTLELYADPGATVLLKSIPGVGVSALNSDQNFQVGDLFGGITVGSLNGALNYHVEVDGTSGGSDFIKVNQIDGTAGTKLVVAGDLIVELLGDTPTVGQMFTILQADEIMGEFDSITLPNGVWDTSQLYSSGKITYGIPSPTAGVMGLMMIGGIGLGRRRRTA